MFTALNLWEANILAWIETLRGPVLDPIILFFTHLGDAGLLFIALTLALLIFPKTRKIGLATALALIFSLLYTNAILKHLFQRARPWEAVDFLHNLVVEHDTSFPSGHTSAAFAFALAFVRCETKRWAKITVIVIALFMGLSRLYVGAHYPTDVLAGCISGGLAGLSGWYVSTILIKKFSKPALPRDTHS